VSEHETIEECEGALGALLDEFIADDPEIISSSDAPYSVEGPGGAYEWRVDSAGEWPAIILELAPRHAQPIG